MHTEHLRNVHVGWVVAGWLVAVAVTSLLVVVAAGTGFMPSAAGISTGWSLVAVVVGFLVGGLFLGFRSIDAPILHGIAIGIFTLLAWFVINLVVVVFFPDAAWEALPPVLSAGLLLLQMVAAVLGAWAGHTIATHGGPDVTD